MRFRQLAVVAAAVAGLSTASAAVPQAAFADPCGLPFAAVCDDVNSLGLIDNTGDSEVPPIDDPTIVEYVPPVLLQEDKLVRVTALLPEVTAAMEGVTVPAAASYCVSIQKTDSSGAGCGGGSAPTARALNWTLYQQTTSYTCAPTSARMVLKHMTGTDFGEMGLASAMHTSSSSGTYYKNLEQTLNAKQSIDAFIGEPHQVTDPSDVMSRVVYDNWYNHNMAHGVILNVNQRYLGYWNRTTNGRHYITAYGYDYRNGSNLWVGDPVFTIRQFPTLQESYTAVKMNKGLVVW